jgi:hypothetical protein
MIKKDVGSAWLFEILLNLSINTRGILNFDIEQFSDLSLVFNEEEVLDILELLEYYEFIRIVRSEGLLYINNHHEYVGIQKKGS